MYFLTRPDGVIELRLKEATAARYVKVHCYFDDRDEENNPIPDAYATAGNTALKLMKVFYMAESRQEVYGYDAIGNRTTQSISSDGNTTTTSYVYYKNTAGGDSQRLQSDGTYTYEYDNNGNLLRKTEIATGNIWEYEFNLLNRLVAVYRKETTDGAESHSEASSGRTRIATYVYDEAGYRVRKQSTEKGMTDYVFSAHGVVLFEEKSAGDYREYVYVFNDLFAKVEGKAAGDGSERKKYFYHTDYLGSTTAITDASGAVVWKNDFTPFGTETGYEGAEEHDAKFTGKDFDEEIALYYFNARWYDPELGRFISQDPIKDGVNWYVYCADNPLIYIDEDGLEHQWWEYLIPFYDLYAIGDDLLNHAFKACTSSWRYGMQGGNPTDVGEMMVGAVYASNPRHPLASVGQTGGEALISQANAYIDSANLAIATVGDIELAANLPSIAKGVSKLATSAGRKLAARTGATATEKLSKAAIKTENVATKLLTEVADAPENIGSKILSEKFGVKVLSTEAAGEGARDTFVGVRQASEYLKAQGVSRADRVRILQSFEVDAMRVRTAGDSEFGLRFISDPSRPGGSYLFETFPASRESLAIKPEWSTMSGIRQFQIKPGTVILEGPTAAQGPYLPGGQKQKFILDWEKGLMK